MTGRFGFRGIPVWGILATALFLGHFAACSRGPGEPPSVILISIDTARVDRFGLYGNPRPTSPYLDAIGRRGLVFDQAVTVTENTLISHASLFTGLFPAAHGTTYEDGGVPLNSAYVTLAEDFLESGLYQTAGFAAHGTWLCEKFGMDQGFQVFQTGFRSADVVLEEAETWLKDRRDPDKPFFLFIHLFDPHSDFDGRPYQAPEPFHGRWTSDYQGRFTDWEERTPNGSLFLVAVTEGRIRITPKEAEHFRDQYDEGLAYTDDRLGRFLEKHGRGENLFVVITSDHGEEFLEHGYMLHSSLYDPVVRIPLIIVPPPDLEKRYGVPRRLREQVRIVDLRPTLLDMAGLPTPEACQGVSLNSWLTGRDKICPAGPAPFYHTAVRWDGFKLYETRQGPALFDLTADPGEQVNLHGLPEHQERIDRMNAFLRMQVKQDLEVRAVLRDSSRDPKSPMDARDLDRLRSLGYIK